MKVSYNWLQEYFEGPLPSAEEVGELLTFHAYEVEGIEQVGDDYVIDVDVLPNRSSDSLSHRGIARELGTLLDRRIVKDSFAIDIETPAKSSLCEVSVDDTNLCSRYMAVVVQGVKVGPSPDWLKTALETVGQRSINNIVDATNFVMLNLGQPLHAFDADKLEGNVKKIVVRSAKDGEDITTLTGDEYTLTPETLLITDGVADVPLAIAGIKGGKTAEVDENTTNIILESAHFNPTEVRKTAQRLRLTTDSSQRFQNNPSQRLVGYAMHDVAGLITSIAGGEIEGASEVSIEEEMQKPVHVSVAEINALLGTNISKEETVAIFDRLGFAYTEEEGVFAVTPPFERSDINIKEDIIEEVGRVYGYEHVEAKELPSLDTKPEISKTFYFADKIRNVLCDAGYSEIYGYTFRNKGDVEAITALASDKRFLRTNLSDGLREYIDMNTPNAPLLGMERIRVFEIGSVFPKSGEYLSLAIGVSGKKAEKEVEEVRAILTDALGIDVSGDVHDGVLEIDFAALIELLDAGDAYEPFEKNEVTYKEFSPYPFVSRDIALWVPEGTSSEEVAEVLVAEAGELLATHYLFDEFTKEGRVSYAFRLIFQSHERTLTDEEIEPRMENITNVLTQKGYEVR